MYRRKDIALYKVKELEQISANEDASPSDCVSDMHCDIEYDIVIDELAMKLIKQFVHCKPTDVNFLIKAFNQKYNTIQVAAGPKIKMGRFYKGKQHGEIFYDLIFKDFLMTYLQHLTKPNEFETEMSNKKSTITYKLTSKGYQFVQLDCAPQFKAALDEYLYTERMIMMDILELADKITALDLANVREHIWLRMRSWDFPYQESDGLKDIDYDMSMVEIIEDLAPNIRSIIKNVCFIEKSLRQDYEAVMKENGKNQLKWDAESYSEQLFKLLPDAMESLNHHRTAKLLALFACFDDDIGIERPTAVIGAMTPLSKFANAIANRRRIIKCDAVAQQLTEAEQKIAKEKIACDDISAESNVYNQLNTDREKRFLSKKQWVAYATYIKGIISIFGTNSNANASTQLENSKQTETNIAGPH